MLRFTKQVDYGLMAMQYIAEHQGDARVGVKRIADQFGIPVELLAKKSYQAVVVARGSPPRVERAAITRERERS